MRVLVVEDDVALAQALCASLTGAGMLAEHCADGVEAQALGCIERYDAAVLDLGLQGCDGVTVLAHWRAQGQHYPVLVLTARGRWSDKLAAFQAGADDYLVKPCLQDELVMRLRVLHRRASGAGTPVMQVGALAYDTVADRFTLAGVALVLTAQEQRILAYLIGRQGQVVSRSDIAEHVYARDLDPDSNSVDVLLGRIRRKLAPYRLIHTERGRGFRLQDGADGEA